ncbi:Gfo/Idh/MocA family protein [Paenibacillus sp. NPDC056579]|uniref:Gfo/Idh/MocA family protein n=1 Tax=Paenibacillus sp. NPDC056579 TaxID=3345871 RepID=UPI0036B07719
MTLKAIIVGTGGWGKTWVTQTLPKAVQEGQLEVVAAVDVNPDSLKLAEQYLGLSSDRCFTELEQAFAATAPQVCIIASPPHTREHIAVFAMENGCDVLCEKPLADTLEASCKIVQKARELGKKVGVTMTHRFRQPIWTFRELVRSGNYGALDYLVFNFNWNRRDGLKDRQAKMDNTMLIEGAIHQLDLLEHLAGARCETVYMDSWTPKWGNFTGSAQAMLALKFENAVRASYETAWCNASAQNSWEQEYIRAEFEHATVVLNRGAVEVFAEEDNIKSGPTGMPVPLKENAKWGNDYLLESFLQWVHGGPAMETNAEANLNSMTLLFAAIESSKLGMPVRVRQFAADNGLL